MIKSGSAPRLSASSAGIRLLSRFKWFFGPALAVALAFGAVAQTPPPQDNPDQQYIKIMALIDHADALRDKGQTNAAKAKYLQAEKALLYFKATNPLFDPKIVNYRLKQVTDEANTREPIAEAPTPAPVQKPKTNAANAEVQSPGNAEVKLLDPGAEPRNKLRLHVTAGDKQTMIMTIKMTMQVPMPAPQGRRQGEANPPPTSQTLKLPAMTIPMDITVQSVAPNGDITYQGVIGEPGTTEEQGTIPQVAQGMKTVLAGIKGTTVSGTMTSQGVSKKVNITTGTSASAQTSQAVDQMKEGFSNMGARLPDEAVGPGAKWEIQRTVKSQGMSVDQTEDYELVSVEGDHVKIKTTITQKAGNQKIQNPAMGNVQMNLNEMNATGSGTVEADLSKLVAATATFDMHMDMNADVTVRNKKQPIDMTMDMNIDMEAK
ncbi:MAG TPA: hypothetical protein VN873_16025 [Candidatus Angelobacter sp.]|nr:hypothetical protein [Candidatus Angelobacter sp.]